MCCDSITKLVPSTVCHRSRRNCPRRTLWLFFIHRPPTLLPVHCCGHLRWDPWQLATDEELDEGYDVGNEEDDEEDDVADDNQVVDDENEGFDKGNGHDRFE